MNVLWLEFRHFLSEKVLTCRENKCSPLLFYYVKRIVIESELIESSTFPS